MAAREIVKGVYWVGALDFDRKNFDELMPLPCGTSYNAYLVRGSEKTALIDTVDPAFAGELLRHLQALGVKSLDYVIANHAEQDHSGTLPLILEKYPGATLLTSPKGKEFLLTLLALPEARIRTVHDGEKIPLGDRHLEFIHFPWVHWPETMLTYCPQDKILFSCDLFGSHLATPRLLDEEEGKVLEAALLYFAQIMMPFSAIIKKNLGKVQALPLAWIAPSHGPCHRRPAALLDAYRRWTGEETENLAVVAYVSMHGSTKAMAEHLLDRLIERGVEVAPFNLGQCDLGQFAAALVMARTLLFGSSTVMTGLHPRAVFAAHLAGLLKPKAKLVGCFGSYGWAEGKMVEQFGELIGTWRAEKLPPVIGRGHPDAETLAALDRLAAQIAENHGRPAGKGAI